MNAVRSFLPTDLPALFAHSGLGSQNEAWPRERLGAGDSQATLAVVRDQLLSFARRRGSGVSVRRQRLQGLVGVRQRGGVEAWEIDYLLDTTKDRSVTAELLEYATIEAGKEGAHKLFLRLSSDSSLQGVVRDAGFAAYQEETLYVKDGGVAAVPAEVREAAASDSYPLFRLYCQSTPEQVRRLEAATFAEWHAAQERRWLKNGIHLVQEQNGRLVAHIKGARLPQGLVLEAVSVDGDVRGMISAARQATGSSGEPVFVLVPLTSEGVARHLEVDGFSVHSRYVSLALRTARPLTLPKKVPVVAENAIGV